MQDASLIGTLDHPVSWPPFGPPLSEYSTVGLWSMAFLTLFPTTGAADYLHHCDRRLALHEWVKHLIRYKDSRFARHPRFRFFDVRARIFRHQ